LSPDPPEVDLASKWAKAKSDVVSDGPIEVVVDCWVTRTDEDAVGSGENSTSLAKSARRPRKTV